MIRFEYKARDKENKKITGLVDAADEKQALRILRSRSLLVIDLYPKTSGLFGSFKASFQKVRFKDVVNFTRQFSTMITAGLSLTEALNIISDQSNPAFQKVLKQVVNDIEGGSTLHEALSKYPKIFGKMYLALIKSGESAGVLDKILMRLADTLEKQKEFRGKMKGALIYPAIVVVGMIIVVFVMMVFVIPKITNMFLEFDLELPFATKVMISASNFTSRFWFIILGFGFFAFIFFKKWRETDSGKASIDQLLLNLPVIGFLNEQILLTEMTRTLSLLVAGGVSIIESLNIVADVTANKIYEDAIKTVAKDVEKGVSIGAAIGKYPFFPPIIAQMMGIGEETGKLDDVLMKVSRHFEMESDFAVKGLTSSIEPLMIILLAFGVGFLVFAVLMPIYKLTSSF
jgi:type IV pilus assembly protein PilC